MSRVTVSTDVEIDLGEFDTQDLIDELAYRGVHRELGEFEFNEIIDSIYQKRRLGKDYQSDLDKLIYNVLGRIV